MANRLTPQTEDTGTPWFAFIALACIFFGLPYILMRGINEQEKYRATLSECDRIEYDIERAGTVFRKANALKVKEIAILQGKCK